VVKWQGWIEECRLLILDFGFLTGREEFARRSLQKISNQQSSIVNDPPVSGEGSGIRFHGIGAGGETGTQRGGDGTAETALEEAGADVPPGSSRARPGKAQDLRTPHSSDQ